MRAVTTIALSLLFVACAPAEPIRERASPSIEETPEIPEPEAEGSESPGPDATDPPSESGLPAPGACEAPSGYLPVDLADLLADPGAWDGQPVVTVGLVLPRILCTAMECPPVATCCERCHVSYVMNGPPDGWARVDEDVDISIDQPACVQTCDCPKKGGPIGDSIVWGTFRLLGDHVAIETDGFC